jgi:hypothetical protein
MIGLWMGVIAAGVACGSALRQLWTPRTLEPWWLLGPLVMLLVTVPPWVGGRLKEPPGSGLQSVIIILVAAVSFAISGDGFVASVMGLVGWAGAGLGLGLYSLPTGTSAHNARTTDPAETRGA